MTDQGTILIVDDTPADLELLVDALTAQGYQVVPAESGEQALASVAARPPELILLDIQMPGVDGFEVCRRLKARPESRDIPIMFNSVSGERAERLAGFKLGAVDYITKPFEGEELLARVRAHLELGRLRVRLERQAAEVRQANKELQSELAERKRAEEELQFKNILLSAQQEASLDGMLMVDEKARILSYNRRFIEMWGLPARLVEDKVDEPVLQFVMDQMQDPRSFLQRVQYLYEHNQDTSRDELILADGRVFDRYSAPICGPEERYYGRVWYFRDLTERKRSEEKLRQLSRAVEQSPALIVITNPAGDIEYVNPKFIEVTGYTLAEALGKNPRVLKSGDKSPEAYRELWQTITAGKEWRGEFHNKRKNGELYWESASISPIRDLTGRTTHYVAVKEDITERKQSEAALEKAHQALVDVSRQAGMAEIATNVLHNVGNVLNSVNISTGLLVQSVKKSRASSLARVVVLLQEHAHDLGAFITQDSRGKHLPAHLAQLSEHLLAEQETNVRELDSLRRNVDHIKEIVAMQQSYATFGGVKEMVNVVNLVEDSLRMNEGALSRHEVEVIREFEDLPPLNVEKHKILQILVNLLRNAKYACDDSERADKRLTVRVANGDGRVRISVIDNGVGIPPENLTRIFNHGFTTRKGGHGFGLHSSALAAKEMGGSLTVHSDGPGQGATFTLELPVGSAANAPTPMANAMPVAA
jgi:PAS domain S-box-containing protein